jgi:outer membrane protein assembly factor BamB
VTFFRGAHPEALWLRDHDGLALGPDLLSSRHRLVTAAQGKGAAAYCAATGRELWRVDPPRTQKSFLRCIGSRVFLCTDAGSLYALDLEDGQVRFRMRAALPFISAVEPWGNAFIGGVHSGGQSIWFAADAISGQPLWTEERPWSFPAPALPLGVSRALIGGTHDGAPLLECVGKTGALQWSKRIPLAPGPMQLVAPPKSALAFDRTGAAVCLDASGEISWRLGAAGTPLVRAVSARWLRQVLLIPGERVRAVDVRGGRELAEIEAGPGLRDLAVDAHLNLYVLDDAGELKCYALASHLALVG